MTTILADSFTAVLAKLANDEQKQAKLTAFDLQANPDQPGLQSHRIDKSKDPNFWSVRVSRDIRIIAHRTGASLMLAYVDHHDDAYKRPSGGASRDIRQSAPSRSSRCASASRKWRYTLRPSQFKLTCRSMSPRKRRASPRRPYSQG